MLLVELAEEEVVFAAVAVLVVLAFVVEELEALVLFEVLDELELPDAVLEDVPDEVLDDEALDVTRSVELTK